VHEEHDSLVHIGGLSYYLAPLESRWNWRIESVERVNSAEERPVISDAFCEWIIDDNPYDMAFYEFARSNC
jgi:hypothetical protein